MKYSPLSVKTGYSFFASSLRVSDLVNYAKEKGNSSVCISDNNNVFGALELASLAKQNNLKYVIGMEVFLNEDDEQTSLILLAKNKEGYRSITRLTSLVSNDDLTYQVRYEDLLGNLEGIKLMLPCLRSKLFKLYYTSKEEIPAYLEKIKKLSDDFVLGLECYDESQIKFLNYCRTLDLPKCIANSVNYLNKEDSKLLDILSFIKTKVKVESNIDHNFALYNDEFIAKTFSKEEIKLNDELLDSINFDIYETKAHLISFPLANKDVSKKDYLKALCYKGLKKRLNNKVSEEYYSRLNYELDMIDKMGYTNYFLVVWDYVKFAKQNNILVGPGRGSGAGSLVSYVLGITNVDPIKYGLIFERFLNPERVSMPDIDVDFIDNKREQVIDYLFKKYSNDHVLHVVAFQTYKAKQALRDAANALGLSPSEVDVVSKRVPRNKVFFNASLKKIYDNDVAFKNFIDGRKIYRDIFDLALKLEGLPRQTTHIAGVVLCDEVLSEVTPVYHSGDIYTTQYSKDYVESIGLLKMDVLALTDLAVIENTIKNIKESSGKDVDIYSIDYNDPKIYEILNKDLVQGIFQLDKSARLVTKQIVPTCFNNLVAILALSRPGPMNSTPIYANCKNKGYKVDYIDESLKDILLPTYGIMVYQEQVMQVIQAYAGFSLGEADIIRRAISKKNERTILAFKDDFFKKAKALNRNEQTTAKLYELILKFADYGFNKSHTVSYAMISATMAYLKAYYPREFYCAVMDRHAFDSSDGSFFPFVEELKGLGLEILPPSANKSLNKFASEQNGVRFPLQCIKGISNISANAILKARKDKPFVDIFDFVSRVYGQGIDKAQIVSLIDAGALDEFNLTRATMKNALEDILLYAHVSSSSNESLVNVEAEKPLINIIEDDLELRMANEIEVLGSYFCGFSFEYDREKLKRNNYLTLDEVNASENKVVKTVVFARSISSIKTKNKEMMAMMDGIDKTSSIKLVIFPKVYQTIYHELLKGNSYYVEGKVSNDKLGTSLIVERIALYKNKKGGK